MAQWNPEDFLNTQVILETRVVLSAAELDVFTILSKTPLSLDSAAERMKAVPRALAQLLDALASMELLEKQNGEYFCPPSVAEMLASGSPKSILPMVRHLSHVWANATKLTSKVLGGHEVEGLSKEDQTRAFIGGMHVRARQNADAIVAQIGADRHTKLIDIGGASGTYTIAFLRANPNMTATLFDQPLVTDLAAERLKEEGLINRVKIVTGDFYIDPLPAGYDLAYLSAIVHQNSQEQNIELYKKAFEALSPGGRLVIRDHVMSEDHTSPRSGAIFAINMLCGTDIGGTYSLSETKAALEEAGFGSVSAISLDAHMDCLVEAFKPK